MSLASVCILTVVLGILGVGGGVLKEFSPGISGGGGGAVTNHSYGLGVCYGTPLVGVGHLHGKCW